MIRSDDASKEVFQPEELVRKETKAVNFLRALLIAVLVIVGAVLSYSSYKLERKSEQETYEREFKAIASRMISDFKNKVDQLMWGANVIGNAISSSSDLIKVAPNFTIPNFDKLVMGALYTNQISLVYWSPLIYGEKNLKQWEAYAQRAMNSTSSPSQPCYACGSSNLTVGLTNKKVVLPTGTYTCGDMDYAGANGLVPPEYCSIMISFAMVNCGCRPTTAKDVQQVSVPRSRSYHVYQTTNHEFSGNATMPVQGPGPFLPVWQVYPSGYSNSLTMYDWLTDKFVRGAGVAMINTQKTVISDITWYDDFDSLLVSPVFENLGDSKSKILGTISFFLRWATFLENIAPFGSKGLDLILENTCGQTKTFQSTGDNVVSVGSGDLHDPAFSAMMVQTTFEDYFTTQTTASPLANGANSRQNCGYRFSVYASESFRSNYTTTKPRMYAAALGLIFLFTTLLFITYDCYVTQRQRKVMEAALQRDEIVSSLFPAAVRARLFNSPHVTRPGSATMLGTLLHRKRSDIESPYFINTSSLHGNRQTSAVPRSEPIADFFPSVTIVFADISGFTAWSSEREPAQVFQLLETVYQAFDRIAAQFGVFKIETIGDCYVAVAGLPVFQPDHAVRIVKFAYECVIHMHQLTHELESTLGPSTSSLSIRVGVHSGPVIAGVLRGEKSRFQLFGDTMNTTARMQTTGEINRIQISQATANLLREVKKSHWIQRRDDQVAVKGKGLIQTYWVDPHKSHNDDEEDLLTAVDNTVGSISRPWGEATLSEGLSAQLPTGDKMRRLVEWNTDLLLRFLKKIVATRKRNRWLRSQSERVVPSNTLVINGTPLQEVTEILPMLDFFERTAKGEIDPESVDLGETVSCQLQDYVTAIADMYRDNPFHNFEHASHVALSASKVVMRIIKPDVEDRHGFLTGRMRRVEFKRRVHDSTFGISSDVMMQFAVVFSAIIHDADHVGVSNAQLVKEGQEIAQRYSGKCVAEQNSVDLAWNLLMQDKYRALLNCICRTEQEQQRFRQLLVNAVIATDIADKELQLKRKNRWDKAFHCGSDLSSELYDGSKTDMDRKATIVFEYIIQASDVAHTMQHWKVYKHWNERLFEERYKAYLCGREEQDPSIGWYKGEIWFFDNYIIPLAKKLETCGVFGVSSDEYLSYALENRHEWELEGEEIVRSMVQKYSTPALACEQAVSREPVEILS